MSYTIEQRDEQLLNTTAHIRYGISFPRAVQHLIHITMEVDVEEDDEITAVMPTWLPGSYKIRDFASNQGDLSVTDDEGAALSFEWIGSSRLRIPVGGVTTVRISYVYYANDRTVRTSHVNRYHAFFNPGNCLMYVEGRMNEIHHVSIDHSWSHVSTALSPVRDGVWGALNYDILLDSPVEVGDHFVARYERNGAIHEVAITGDGRLDRNWLVEQTRTIVDRELALWGELPYDRYVFILHLVPSGYGGLEHARSSVNMFDGDVLGDPEKMRKLLTLLCHEFFHTWNVKRIRPAELGPFDYVTGNHSRMLWLAEGVTSYYDDLLSYRCGFHSRREYLQTLSTDHLGRLLDTPGRLSMSIKDSSYLAWVKLYVPTPDSGNRFPSYYLKGGVIFLLLDMTIIAETNGEKSLDDGLRALWEQYKERPERGVTEEEFIRIVGDAVGLNIGDTLRNWLNAADELPVAETVARIGLEWRVKRKKEKNNFGADLAFQPAPPERWFGWMLTEEKTGLKVSRVLRDSPVEAAGIGADDEIIALNGLRVTDMKKWKAVIDGIPAGTPLTITAAAEGRLYETGIEPIERETYELAERENLSDDQRKRLEKWMNRF